MDPTTEDSIIFWIQKRIRLSNYDDSLWTHEHDNVVDSFISSPSSTRIFAFVDSKINKLYLKPEPPSISNNAVDVAFFVRPSGSTINFENIDKIVQFGTFSTSQTAASVICIIEQIFFPQIFFSANWPRGTRIDLAEQYHRLMAYLTEKANNEEGKTVLYLPLKNQKMLEIMNDGNIVSNRDFVQQLESIAILWTKQIKVVLNNFDQIRDFEVSGPMEEIEFWRSRAIDLSSISTQLCSDDIKYILDILRENKSSYLAPVEALTKRIEHGSLEAEDNIKFLEVLSSSCQQLTISKPSDIGLIITSLLNHVRFISKFSKFYNTKDRISGLLRKISNEIIHRCRAEISLDDIFEGDIELAIESLEDSIKCCIGWKSAFQKVAFSVNEEIGNKKTISLKWDFDEVSIFAQMEAFLQRCRDLRDICDGQIQFVRKSSSCSRGCAGELPDFGGTNGEIIIKSVLDIEKKFLSYINKFKNCEYDILDVRSSQWHDDLNEYKNAVKVRDICLV